MSDQISVDERRAPSTPPLFWKYDEGRNWDHTIAVTSGFGNPGQLRAVVTVPGASWRTAVLGLTAPGYQATVPRATRMLVRRSAVQVQRMADLRAIDPERHIRLPANLRLAERLPDELFLDLFNIPTIILQAAQNTWQKLAETLPRYKIWDQYDTPEFWAGGRRWLGTVETMRERLQAGGLFADEWHMLNVWVLGALERLSPMETPRWLQAVRDAWQWLEAQVRRLKKSQPPPPDQPHPAPQLHQESHFHLLGLELQTCFGADLVAASAFGLNTQPSFLFCPDALPPSLDVDAALREHTSHWQQEHHRRQKIYYWSGKIIATVVDLLVQYVVLGPVGLIITLLRLLAEGLFRVRQGERLLTWPSLLPEMEGD